MSTTNTSIQKVLTEYVIENTNLKIAIEELKTKIAQLESEKEESNEQEE